MLRKTTAGFVFNQVPQITVEIFKHCDRTIRLLDRFSCKFYTPGLHLPVITPEIIGAQKQENTATGRDTLKRRADNVAAAMPRPNNGYRR